MTLLILFVGLYGLVVCDNLIRKIMSLTVVQGIVVMSFLTTGFQAHAAAPILSVPESTFVDPVPQALMLTAIVIGVCFNALALAFVVKYFQHHGTIEISEIHER
ncbi:MAG: Na+/H+ antiporter subunit C [Spirochaetaceae bacterium]|nr:MAG: Na+/H+ antiporter subunit C [Spirochaetaceae bacterium]